MPNPDKNYFENLATICLPIAHTPQSKAFFEIEDADELNEFDDALRTMLKETCMLMVNEGGEFDDSGSENHTDTIEIQLYILKLKRESNTISQLRSDAKNILLEVLKKVKADFKISAANKYRFRISGNSYTKVGPMGNEGLWYGYTAILRFTCPFGAGVNSAIWQ